MSIPLTDRYLARLIVVPLIGVLVLSAMLLVLDMMLRLFDFVISEGGPVSIVWKMLAGRMPEYLALSIPIALMMGILFAFRKLALTSELDTLRGVGLGFGRLLRVPYLFAFLLMGANLAIVGFAQPKGRYLYDSLRFELRSGALGASIKVGEFTNLGKRMTIRVERSENEGRLLHGVFARAETKGGKTLAVTADQGRFLATDDPDTILLRLTNGRLVHDAPEYREPRVLSFASHDLPIDLPAIAVFRPRGAEDDNAEKTLPELLKAALTTRAPAKSLAAARANFHFRMVEIAIMLLVPLLAVALAVPPKRSTSGLGIFVGLVMIVAYHKINQYAEDMGAQGRIDPAIALWVPFAFFAALIFWMYWTIAHKPGGQPIGALERIFAKAGKSIARILRLGRGNGQAAPA